MSRRPDGSSAHASCLLLKIPFHHVFDPQSFDTLDTRDPLVEIACDPGIDLSHLAASRHNFLLKIHDDQDRGRYHDQYICGQPGIDSQHDTCHTDNVGYIPDHIHHAPGHQLPDPLGVAHGPRMDIADAVLVKVGKRQSLQMRKCRVAQVPVDLHFHLSALIQAVIVVQLLQDHQSNIQ